MTHRSRLGWADPMDEEPVAAVDHVCRVPRSVRWSLMGLVVAVSLVVAAVVLLLIGWIRFDDYVQGRGEQRDQENAELNQRIDDAVQQGQCTLLDQLPAGGFLDRLRATFDCGPGIPLDQLPPEIRQRFDGTPAPSRPAESATVPLAPPLGSAASPAAPDPVPNVPTAPREPSPEPASPPPLVDLGPITEPVCDVLGVCV